MENQQFEMREQMAAIAKAQGQPVEMTQQYPNNGMQNGTQVPQGQEKQYLHSTMASRSRWSLMRMGTSSTLANHGRRQRK